MVAVAVGAGTGAAVGAGEPVPQMSSRLLALLGAAGAGAALVLLFSWLDNTSWGAGGAGEAGDETGAVVNEDVSLYSSASDQSCCFRCTTTGVYRQIKTVKKTPTKTTNQNKKQYWSIFTWQLAQQRPAQPLLRPDRPQRSREA